MMSLCRSIAALVLLGVVTSACAQAKLHAGVKPPTERLSLLVLGKSKPVDILLALGEPRGKGGARFADYDSIYRDIWFYEYFDSNVGNVDAKVDVKLLVVFLRDGTYDGYWWVSTVH